MLQARYGPMAFSSSAKIAGSLREIRGIGRAQEVSQIEPRRRPGGIAHGNSPRDARLAEPSGDLPDQLGLDRPRRVDPPVQGVVSVLQELEDAVLARVLPRHDPGPCDRAERREDRPEGPRDPLPHQPRQVGQGPLAHQRGEQVPGRPVEAKHENLHPNTPILTVESRSPHPGLNPFCLTHSSQSYNFTEGPHLKAMPLSSPPRFDDCPPIRHSRRGFGRSLRASAIAGSDFEKKLMSANPSWIF